MSRLIHLDLSRDLFGSSLNTDNCVFLRHESYQTNLNEITDKLIELIEQCDEKTDVRDLLQSFNSTVWYFFKYLNESSKNILDGIVRSD